MWFAGLAIALSLCLVMGGAWRIGLNSGHSGRIDSLWSFATGIACIAAVMTGAAAWPRALLLAGYFTLWAGRLGYYLWRRAEHGDDPRYAALMKQWGEAAPSKLFLFLQAQAIASWPLALSAAVAAASPRPALDFRDLLALVVFLIALVGEGIADAQMAAFRADPRNRGGICDRGLWSWSRHPNYFFQWFGWLGLPLMAIGPDHSWGWLALLAPAEMYWLLVHVSGVPPLEESMRRSRGVAFEAYRARISAFWPWPPKRG